jgi:hypothetical protein
MQEPMMDIRVQGVGRMADNDKAILVSFNRPLADYELRALHEYLRDFERDFDWTTVQESA